MRKVRIGVAGIGRMGRFHAEDIAYRMKDADLTAVCCRSEDRARQMQQELGASYAFSSYEEMLDCEELDAVVICTASEKHCEQVIKAIEAGIHVFCEKPLGLTSKECLTVEEAALENKNIVVQAGFMTRYDMAYRKARGMITEGRIGRPVYFRSYRMDAVEHIQSSIDFAVRSGGLFFDVAVHDFDLARWMLDDELVSVYAMGGCYRYRAFEATSDCDNGIVTMQFRSGAMGTILSGRTCAHGFRVETEIIGTHGTVYIGEGNGQPIVYLYDERGVDIQFARQFIDRFGAAFLEEKKEFVRCIQEGTSPEVTVYDAVAATKAAEAADESYKTKDYKMLDDWGN